MNIQDVIQMVQDGYDGDEIEEVLSAEVTNVTDLQAEMVRGMLVAREREEDILAALSGHDHGDGCLGIMVRAALREDPNATIEEIREGIIEAEREASERQAAP